LARPSGPEDRRDLPARHASPPDPLDLFFSDVGRAEAELIQGKLVVFPLARALFATPPCHRLLEGRPESLMKGSHVDRSPKGQLLPDCQSHPRRPGARGKHEGVTKSQCSNVYYVGQVPLTRGRQKKTRPLAELHPAKRPERLCGNALQTTVFRREGHSTRVDTGSSGDRRREASRRRAEAKRLRA